MGVKIETFQRHDLVLEHAIESQKVNADKEAFYSIQLGENGRSILVEPLNGNPYVYEQGGDFTVWKGAPKSGTDAMRARVMCQAHFDELNEPELHHDEEAEGPSCF